MSSLFSSKPSLRPGQLCCSTLSLEALLIYTLVVFLSLWQITVQSKIKEEVSIWSPAWENVSPPGWRRHAGGASSSVAADAGSCFLILLHNRKQRERRLKVFLLYSFLHMSPAHGQWGPHLAQVFLISSLAVKLSTTHLKIHLINVLSGTHNLQLSGWWDKDSHK